MAECSIHRWLPIRHWRSRKIAFPNLHLDRMEHHLELPIRCLLRYLHLDNFPIRHLDLWSCFLLPSRHRGQLVDFPIRHLLLQLARWTHPIRHLAQAMV